MLPGVGRQGRHPRGARPRRRRSAGSPRTAPRPTSPIQHFGLARELGLETVGFLMMAHSPAARGARRRRPGSWPTPAASASTSSTRPARSSSTRSPTGSPRSCAELGDDAQVGFHGHENLALGVANSVAGDPGRRGPDRRHRRAASAPAPATRRSRRSSAVCDKLGIRTGVDVFAIVDAAEDVVRPVMDEECTLDRLALIMGYAGVYSSFLKHAYRAAERYGVSGGRDPRARRRAAPRRRPGGPAHRHRHGAERPLTGRVRGRR